MTIKIVEMNTDNKDNIIKDTTRKWTILIRSLR